MKTNPRRKMTVIAGDDRVMPTAGSHHARERGSTSGEVSTASRSVTVGHRFRHCQPRSPGRPVAHARR